MSETLPPPRHLLVRLPNPLGDAVLATPALRALRRALPETRITWAGGPAALGALQGLAWRDAVLPVAGRFARGALAPFRAGRMWRRAAPDAVLLLPHAFSAALAARRSGARTVVGSRLHGRGWLLDHVVDLPRAGRGLLPRPMTRMYLDLAAPFGARDDGGPPELVVEPYDHERAERRLARAPRPGPWLGVNPGAAFGPAKVYPPERVAAAVAAVCRTNDLVPLVLCGPGEEALGGRVAGLLGAGALSTHERPPDVGELKALLVRCVALLSTDAGPRHVAEALGVPTAVWMGPTDPRWTAGSPGVVVRKEGLPCLGCHRRTCPIGHPCMETLDPEAVAAALRRALAPREGPPGGPAGG